MCIGGRCSVTRCSRWTARRCSSSLWECWKAPRGPFWTRRVKTAEDIDWLIPHQANIRIMQSTANEAQAAHGQGVVTVDQHGNTSAASIPLALDSAVRAGQVKAGQTVMLEGVGGGFTWGAVLLVCSCSRLSDCWQATAVFQSN
jgi:hypothetical protein